MVNQSIIKAVEVHKSVPFEDNTLGLLHNISLEIKSGESVAILGPSGSGKSTLLSLLAGLDVPTKGNVEIFGQQTNLLSEDERASMRLGAIGFVFQRFYLFSGLSALNNVLTVLELSQYGNKSKSDQNKAFISTKESATQNTEKAIALLKQVGLEHRLNHYPHQLSGGEQQRVAIARAFATNPKIIFLDEPTGNLDSHTGDVILDLLFSLNKVNNTTLVLVTHEMKVANLCQTQYHMENGCLK